MCRIPTKSRVSLHQGKPYSRTISLSEFTSEQPDTVPEGSPHSSQDGEYFDWQPEDTVLKSEVPQQPLSFYQWIAQPTNQETASIAVDYPIEFIPTDSTEMLSSFSLTTPSLPTPDPTRLPFEWPLPSPNLTSPNPNSIVVGLESQPSSLKNETILSSISTISSPAIVPTLSPVPQSAIKKPAALPSPPTSGSESSTPMLSLSVPQLVNMTKPKAPSSTPNPSIHTGMGKTLSSEELKVAKRERNRLAAEKYRRKGRELIEKLQFRCDELMNENETLKNSMQQMEEELRIARELLKQSGLQRLPKPAAMKYMA